MKLSKNSPKFVNSRKTRVLSVLFTVIFPSAYTVSGTQLNNLICKMTKIDYFPLSERVMFKTPSKFLKPRIVWNPIYTIFFPIHIYL